MNREELEALYGQSEFLFKLYFYGIRRHMDYATGVVGRKRKISYQSLSEAMYIEPSSGSKEFGSPHKSKIRRALKRLQKIGMIEQTTAKEDLTFKCLLATQDKSVQNKADTRPTHQVVPEADTANMDYFPVPMRPVSTPSIQADTEADTPKNAQADTPPLSVTKKIDITNVISTKEKPKEIQTLFLPPWLDEETWNSFIDHRKDIKAPMKLNAQKLAIKKLEKLKDQGHAPNEVINESILNGWKGLFPIKDNGENHVEGKFIRKPSNVEVFENRYYGKKSRTFDG